MMELDIYPEKNITVKMVAISAFANTFKTLLTIVDVATTVESRIVAAIAAAQRVRAVNI